MRFDFAGQINDPVAFATRFARDGVLGGDAIQEHLAAGLGRMDPGTLVDAFEPLWDEARRTLGAGASPRVFISHQQADTPRARELATIAEEFGFDTWLDVLDPLLGATWVVDEGKSRAEAIAGAAVIEMALLNCTHVLALYTQNAAGSAWVPYEYGRVKDPRVFSPQAACIAQGVEDRSLPEYLLLGKVFREKRMLAAWLTDERRKWSERRRAGGG